ncbi:Photosystem I reaction center subunit III [Rhynchospora pubera]|uniref:Photosystem I reaction center subunit III n=1 Tax=Rhynchospora pubera TaxID=906938 RepID=A0AAV8CVJ1_9POAL|nr:Photosystem I reaction center subunit III [Rhynchospora pubera]
MKIVWSILQKSIKTSSCASLNPQSHVQNLFNISQPITSPQITSLPRRLIPPLPTQIPFLLPLSFPTSNTILRKQNQQRIHSILLERGYPSTPAMASLTSIPTFTPSKVLSQSKTRLAPVTCSLETNNNSVSTSLKSFSAALALSSLLLTSTPPPASADISGLTPCKESKAFAKREKQSIRKLESSLKKYAPDSAPALAIKATIEKTKRRFDNYGKFGLLCGSDGLPHLIVNGDQRHWGEFITPGLLFLYIAGWIGWVGRSYLIAIRDEKKPTMKEIIIDVPLALSLVGRGFIWPVAAYRELVNGDLVVDDADVAV